MRDLAKFKKAKVSLAGALGLLLALGLLVTLVTPVSAVPQPSHRFWGTVSISGALAPEGTEVVATIEGVAEEFSTVVDANHHYGYVPTFYVEADDPDTPAKEGGTTGDTIEFYVAGTLATTFPFEVGGSGALNLSVGAPGALVADAGGPYSGTVDESVSLSGSAAGGVTPYSYAWDLDDDGYYDDSTARTPSYTWDAAGDYTVGLQVTDSAVPAHVATDTASVDISAAAPAPTPGVGGTAYPPDKLSLLAPWIALGGAVAVVGWFLVRRRRAYR